MGLSFPSPYSPLHFPSVSDPALCNAWLHASDLFLPCSLLKPVGFSPPIFFAWSPFFHLACSVDPATDSWPVFVSLSPPHLSLPLACLGPQLVVPCSRSSHCSRSFGSFPFLPFLPPRAPGRAGSWRPNCPRFPSDGQNPALLMATYSVCVQTLFPYVLSCCVPPSNRTKERSPRFPPLTKSLSEDRKVRVHHRRANPPSVYRRT